MTVITQKTIVWKNSLKSLFLCLFQHQSMWSAYTRLGSSFKSKVCYGLKGQSSLSQNFPKNPKEAWFDWPL